MQVVASIVPIKPRKERNISTYIVLCNVPKGELPRAHYINLLSKIIGSEEAAKEALIYTYSTFGGFSAFLNPHQATRLSKITDIYVIPSLPYQILSPSVVGQPLH
ncbi:hypothetical protein FRX31_033518 [Thalictrum thalictroides]|uniref:Inhibitor I9 domain-containing protein n=1 Tax=Thalictrum thalictroides TaxID=46969 RepID=A0A7J6UXD6_THATH|nr:hypothetical protein FRX31_033518 [Thalictrum thalictroides]